MNQNTWISWITSGVGLFAGAAIDRGLVDSQTATAIVGAAGALVPLAWGLFIHSNSSVAKTASQITGVQVAVGPKADASMQQLAADPAVADVVPVAQALPPVVPVPYQTTRRTS
jgi:hypothetical protein